MSEGDLLVGKEVCGDYKIVKSLGEGTFGRVYLVTAPGSAVRYAVKQSISKPSKSARLPEEDFVVEMDVLLRYHHPNVLSATDYYLSANETCTILELAEMTLTDYLSAREYILPEDWEMYVGCCEGLAYLHSQNVIHNDIKADNILLVKGVPKIADFGTSLTTRYPVPYRYETITPTYRAPELFYTTFNYYEPTYYFGKEVDVWGMLMVGLEICLAIQTLSRAYHEVFSFTSRSKKTDYWNLIRQIILSGAYLPPEILKKVPKSHADIRHLKVHTLEERWVESGTPVDDGYRRAMDYFQKAIAAPPAGRVSAEKLCLDMRDMSGIESPRPVIPRETMTSEIAYRGAYTPELRAAIVRCIVRRLDVELFAATMDLFDRLATHLNASRKEVIGLVQVSIYLAASTTIPDNRILAKAKNTPEFTKRVTQAINLLKFRIYRPRPHEDINAIALALRTKQTVPTVTY